MTSSSDISRPSVSRRNLLIEAINNRVLILDGSMGVMIQRLNLPEGSVRGRRFMTHAFPLSGNFDILCLSRPELVADIHRQYLEAGADIIETNTFNANALSQKRYGCSHLVREINRNGAAIARRKCDEFSAQNPNKPRFVAGSMGPTGISASISADVNDPAARSISFEQLADAYFEQACGLIEGGADVLLIETAFDILNAKAAAEGIRRANESLDSDIPFILSITISDNSKRILSGQTIDAVLATFASYKPLALGFNCSAGPDSLCDAVRDLARKSPFPLIFYPNAGLPNELGEYSDSPKSFTEKIAPLLHERALNIVGGCCGTTPDYIAELASLAGNSLPRVCDSSIQTPWLASLEACYDNRGFINVGERCNVAGSRKFLRLIKEKNYAEAEVIARRQAEVGAMVLDINFDDGLLDARSEMEHFLRLLSADPSAASLPWMIDSSNFSVIETALQNVPGKAIVNSISLKHGESEFLQQASVIRRYGAAVVVMLFDENGQATTFERKIEIAERAYRLLVEKADFDPRDIVIDPNVLTIATGMPEHDRYALDFIRAVEWISTNLPGAKTSGGVSNLSFAFRGNNYLRQAMHAVFLYHCIRAGLSMAILDPGAKVTYADLSTPENAELLELLEDAILCRRADATERLIAKAASFAGNKVEDISQDIIRPENIEERLCLALRSGDDSFLESDLAEAVDTFGSANAVVEGPLMKGMELVGQLFEQGKMFLPQVVKCARTMHRAVDILAPHLLQTQSKGATKGTFLLATVKGDVHDIGKNIVKVVLECNNFNVIDLGVQVEANSIVDAVKNYRPDFIGLSGLISPSLEEMAIVADALEENGISIPVFIGGAATSDLHTALKIAPRYPNGVVIRVSDASQNPVWASKFQANPIETADAIKAAQAEIANAHISNKSNLKNSSPIIINTENTSSEPTNSDNNNQFSRQKPSNLKDTNLLEPAVSMVRPFINWIYFLACWRVQPGSREAESLLEDANNLLDEIASQNARMRCVASFYPAFSDGKAIYANGISIPTPRQAPKEGRSELLALCDFIAPKTNDSANAEPSDYIGAFSVTIGQHLRDLLRDARKTNDDYHLLLLQSVCDRLAEACSEWLHREVRTHLWGYAPDEPEDLEYIMKGKYQGIRPAIGYPSLPDQRLMHTLAKLVNFEAIDVNITENGALYPASSIAGLYIASPTAKYFTL